MFESDCWFDWEPDPERAARDAVPTLEPFASLTRRQILDLMAEAKGGREWEFLQEFFLNTCKPEELAVGTEAFIKAQYAGVFGYEEICFFEGAVEMALRRRLVRHEPGQTRQEMAGETPFTYHNPDRFPPVAPVSVGNQAG